MSKPSIESENVRPSGAALPATVSASLGLVALATANLLSEVSVGFNAALQSLGKMWMPGAAGIGPYSGKETVVLLVWLGSWALLHAVWRKRELSVPRVGGFALILVGVATTLLWPPIVELVIHH